jgi:hypothetical protein
MAKTRQHKDRDRGGRDKLTASVAAKMERYYNGEVSVTLAPAELLIYLADTHREGERLSPLTTAEFVALLGKSAMNFADLLRDHATSPLPVNWATPLANHTQIAAKKSGSQLQEQYPLEHRLYFWLKPSFTFEDAKGVTLTGLSRQQDQSTSFQDRLMQQRSDDSEYSFWNQNSLRNRI